MPTAIRQNYIYIMSQFDRPSQCFPAKSKFLRVSSFKKKKKNSAKNLDTIKYGELFMAIYNLILHISYLEPNYRQ